MRGLDTSGKRQDLIERIDLIMEQGAPSVLDEPGGKVKNILRMLRSLYCMISRIMAETINED